MRELDGTGVGRDPNLLVGTETHDDAGVYRLRDDLALVQTVDFFPPLVDDPATYGRIAAANALSDVYAMNGKPLTVLNIVGFPDDRLPLEILGEILQGAGRTVRAAGAVTVGGHSVRDSEIKFGLSVTGLVDPRELWTNAGARVGDVLVLTKPLGTGFLTTASKKQACPEEALELAVAVMIQLNEVGRDAARASGGVHAATDVTGFGLAGHASEMAEGANLTIEIQTRSLPRIPGVEPWVSPKFHNRASRTNREHLAGRAIIEPDADPLGVELAFDAQTSGGLLLAVAPDRADALIAALRAREAASAALIGRVVPRLGPTALILR